MKEVKKDEKMELGIDNLYFLLLMFLGVYYLVTYLKGLLIYLTVKKEGGE